jgi:hypothetical protein
VALAIELKDALKYLLVSISCAIPI